MRSRSLAAALPLLAGALAFAEAPFPDATLPIPTGPAAAPFLRAVTLLNHDGTRPDADTIVTHAAADVATLDLALGDSAAKRIALQARDSTARFRVEQRFETSLTLMDEGPHMDLLDWKHHVSDWEPLPDTDGLHFDSREVMSDRFPDVSTADIVAGVTAAADHWAREGDTESARWVALAGQCRDAHTYPCGVAVSKVTLRISVAVADGWRTIQTIEMRIPMGC